MRHVITSAPLLLVALACVSAPDRPSEEESKIVKAFETTMPAPLDRPGTPAGESEIATLVTNLDSPDLDVFSQAKIVLRRSGIAATRALCGEAAFPHSNRGMLAAMELVMLNPPAPNTMLDAWRRFHDVLLSIARRSAAAVTEQEDINTRVQALLTLKKLNDPRDTEVFAGMLGSSLTELRWVAAQYFREDVGRLSPALLRGIVDLLGDEREQVRTDAGLLLSSLWFSLIPDDKRASAARPSSNPFAAADTRIEQQEEWRAWVEQEGIRLLQEKIGAAASPEEE